MFDPELLGVTSSQFFSIAQSLIAPTLGFMFLFLLSLPLKKLPIVDISDYKPPSWVLPLFALGSLLLFTFCISAALALMVFRAHPSIKDFQDSEQTARRQPTSRGWATGK